MKRLALLLPLLFATPAWAANTWNAADATANVMTLYNNGTSVSGDYYGTSFKSIRNTGNKSSGKLYIEFYVSSGDGVGYTWFGLASAGFISTGPLGSSIYSGGIWPIAGGTNTVSAGFTNNFDINAGATAVGDVMALAVDFGAGNVWIARNNVWIHGNPATGSLPVLSFVPATVGPLFAAISLYNQSSGVWTIRPTPTSQKYAPPGGFSSWDSPVSTAQVGISATTAPELLQILDNTKTWVGFGTVNASTHTFAPMVNGQVGVNCAVGTANLSTMVVTGGIITHC